MTRSAIEEAAAQWLIRREEQGWSETDQKEHDAWMERSMAHKAAFWRLEHAWREADRIQSLGMAAGPRPSTPRYRRAAAWGLGVMAASLVFALPVVAPRLHAPASQEAPARQMIATSLGGRKWVALDDGSRIELNTATAIHTSVTPDRREVWLEKGEAYFEVSHSKEHPFIIYAGPRTITVLGTKFSVRRIGDKLTVSVLEGRVRIDRAKADTAEMTSSTVTTGDVAITEGQSLLVATKSPEMMKASLSWRDGMLSFDQQSLADAAAEFNRYNRTKLVVRGAKTPELRIGGTFQASNVEAFTRLLRDAYGLSIQRENNEIIISD